MGGKEQVMAIFGKARAFWEARTLMTAAELDVFSRLVDSPKTAAQVSDELAHAGGKYVLVILQRVH